MDTVLCMCALSCTSDPKVLQRFPYLTVGIEAKEGVSGVPANADPNRPRPQPASDRSTPSQVQNQLLDYLDISGCRCLQLQVCFGQTKHCKLAGAGHKAFCMQSIPSNSHDRQCPDSHCYFDE